MLGPGKRTRLDTVHATETGGAGTLSVERVTVGILGTAEGGKEAVETGEAVTSAPGCKTSKSWTGVRDNRPWWAVLGPVIHQGKLRAESIDAWR